MGSGSHVLDMDLIQAPIITHTQIYTNNLNFNYIEVLFLHHHTIKLGLNLPVATYLFKQFMGTINAHVCIRNCVSCANASMYIIVYQTHFANT